MVYCTQQVFALSGLYI